MRSEKEPAGPSKARGSPRRSAAALPPASPVPASRRRDLGGAGATRPELCLLLRSYATDSPPQRNAAAVAHMRCSTPASLRASATFARFAPRRLATSSAHRLRAETRLVGVSIALAASYSAVRPVAPPPLLTPPVTSVSP